MINNIQNINIINKNITQDITIEEIYDNINRSIKILYCNHLNTLKTINPSFHKKIHINAYYEEELKRKQQMIFLFVILKLNVK